MELYGNNILLKKIHNCIHIESKNINQILYILYIILCLNQSYKLLKNFSHLKNLNFFIIL